MRHAPAHKPVDPAFLNILIIRANDYAAAMAFVVLALSVWFALVGLDADLRLDSRV